MRMPKFHKLYFPGLISLVFLPIMLICYLISNDTFRKYTAMPVVWESDESLKQWMKFSHKKFDIATFRKYKEIKITGNSKHYLTEREELETLIKQLKNGSDTINGIRVSLSSHAQYGEIVDVLDICNQNKNINGIPYNNKIFIWYIPPPSKSEIVSRLVGMGNDVIEYRESPSLSDKISNWATQSYKILLEFWPSVLAFLLILFFTIFNKLRYLSLPSGSH